MKKMPALVIAVLVLLFSSLAETAFAKPIDRFIGQIRTQREFLEINDQKNKKHILYHGDTLVIERDNRNGKMWVIGKYYTDASNEIVSPTNCIIFFQKKEISPAIAAFGVNINERGISPCR